eukprot:m.123475 g.123475  ORF g.123475 m.123475 type:complete len:555 (-) comp11129_c0_seq4:929-2593(-)
MPAAVAATVPSVIWIMWFALPDTMNMGKGAAVKQLQSESGITVNVLKLDQAIKTLNKDYDPIHPLMKSDAVSLYHKAEYMRVYVLHHYGGAVADFRSTAGTWDGIFKKFEDRNVWLVGGPTEGTSTVHCCGDYLKFLGGSPASCDIVREKVAEIDERGLGSSAMAARAGSPLTHAWLRALNWRLDYLHDDILAHPTPFRWCCHNRTDVRTQAYPLGWTELRDDIFYPLVAKYKDHVRGGLPLTTGRDLVTAPTHPAANAPTHGDVTDFAGPDGVIRSNGHGPGSPTVPVMVWSLWFGKPMSGARRRSFEKIKAAIGVPIRLVTEDNLRSISKSYAPIHPAIFSGTMSAVQRGDYIRAYLMHHYGGGYTDIKPTTKSWRASFDLFTDPSTWVVGNPENPGGTACGSDYLEHLRIHTNCDTIRRAGNNLVTNVAYILRAGTPFTTAWIEAANWRLDQKFDALKLHPAPYQRCCLGIDEDAARAYPLRWAEMHGEIFHPLQYKYLVHVRNTLPRGTGGVYRDATEGLHDRGGMGGAVTSNSTDSNDSDGVTADDVLH